MNRSARIAELSAEILAKQTRANSLALELVASLAIQDIWPDAFRNGNTCKLCARESVRTMQQATRDAQRGKNPELKEMYLQRGDGEKLALTAAQYWQLKTIPRGNDNV